MNTAAYQKVLTIFRIITCNNVTFLIPVSYCGPTTEHHRYYKINPILN
jgi:hypothetical protein